jgi:hypothetical protein
MATKPPRRSARSAPSASSALSGFIAKFEPRHQTLIRAVRKAMRQRLPSANELVYDNYNFFVIGYGPNERPSDCILSIAAGANGVGLAFLHGATLPDPAGILQGSGSRNRFVRLKSAADLADKAVKALITAAVAQSRVPFPAKGKGKLIIRSISKKQRPRRRARA